MFRLFKSQTNVQQPRQMQQPKQVQIISQMQRQMQQVRHPKQMQQPKQMQEQPKMILHRNQNRLPLESEIKQRTILPSNNIIDLHNNINSNLNCNKTIISVFPATTGLGDFLRGSILLAQYAKYFNVNFRLDTSMHAISYFLETQPDTLSASNDIKTILFNGNDNKETVLYSEIEKFIKSNQQCLYITTNLYYNVDLVSDDIKSYINSYFTFKQKYYDIANNMFNFKKYKVLHVRCTDDNFTTDFNDNYLMTEIIKLQLDNNTIVMSNNYALKRKINKMFGFSFLDKPVYHTSSNNHMLLESTILEYILLSNSSSIYAFSYYHHGSGFSEQCSVINDIPYRVVYLPVKSNTMDLHLLINHYDNLLEQTFVSHTEKIHEKKSYDNVAFITLTNNGYIDYTLNCLKSLANIKMEKQLTSYCIGKKGYSILNKNGFCCELIDDETATNFQEFRKQNWCNITYYKFEIIYNNLLNSEYVCITDGDIVYENKDIFDYLLDTIEDNDLLIQSEGISTLDLCSGFMFIKSNEHTKSMFNPENVKLYRNNQKWDDQVYVNSIKHNIRYKKLPLHLFPTGNYYYEYSKNIKPYLIHFNWIVGHEKKNKMISYNKWYISKKVQICQYGTDGFGDQFEGLLRLLSLSINNKADYQYNFKKTYVFEHANTELVTQYLTYALKLLSDKTLECETEDKRVIFREQRTFEQILGMDNNIENTIYCYDGVSSSIPNMLPPNFESSQEIERSLPRLRDAFVANNIYLPKKSYDDSLINVCCHIRLGDAVGGRILDTHNLISSIKEFQKYSKYRVIIHTDGDVKHLQHENTIIYGSDTDVLQVLSDFIYADILIVNYSSLSIAAHLLADEKQNVIVPVNAGVTFKHRTLEKCITTHDLFSKLKTR
jgi:hypothetical protein